MKSTLLIPAAAVVFGFILGWAVKPAPAPPPAPPVAEAPPSAPRVADRGGDSVVPSERPPAEAPAILPADPQAFQGSLQNLAKAREQREIAKMSRLAEALNLTAEQQTAIQELLAQAAQTAASAPADGRFTEGAENLALLEKAGSTLIAGLNELLDPAQREALSEMISRDRENRLEAAAQRELAEMLDRLDLSADQRAAALERSREAAADGAGTLTPELEVMLESSILPLGGHAMSREAAEIFRAAPAAGGEAVAKWNYFERRTRELDARMERMRDILTPAQLESYRAALDEQRVFLEHLRRHDG